MRVTNKTVWRTDHLKAILQRAAEQEFDDGARRKRLHVTVEYTRKGGCSGYAWLNSNRCVVRIANPHGTTQRFVKGERGPWVKRVRVPLELDLADLKIRFASVAVHEFAHCRGMRHRQMPSYYQWSGTWRAYVAWAADLPLEVKVPKVVILTKAAQVDKKLAHVLAMKRTAETRAKRAQTILRKWKRKETYYRRQTAALGVL